MSALPVNGSSHPTKDEAAERLARLHFVIDPGIVRIVRVVSPANEANPMEPIKLLEVNAHTIPSGILPVHFGAHAPSGVPFPTVVMEVHPSEWELIEAGEMKLPHGWVLAPAPFDR
jgi:hypothetical protein